jgi:hypothetical protein
LASIAMARSNAVLASGETSVLATCSASPSDDQFSALLGSI